MTMAEYEKKLLGSLKYVGFINDEKVKIQRFLSGLPTFYKEKIRYDEPKTLTKSIRKANNCMSKDREENPYRNLGRISRRRSSISGGKDSNLPSIGMGLIEIIKIIMLRVNTRKKTPWEKDKDHLSNVGDAKKITCTRISHT